MLRPNNSEITSQESFNFVAGRVIPLKPVWRSPAAQAGDAPALIRIETKAGHGAGKPTAKIIEALADRYAFLVRALKMDQAV